MKIENSVINRKFDVLHMGRSCIDLYSNDIGAGFLYGYVQGWNLYKSIRLGNACGAIVVTRHACSNSMPTNEEAMEFVESRGGL